MAPAAPLTVINATMSKSRRRRARARHKTNKVVQQPSYSAMEESTHETDSSIKGIIEESMNSLSDDAVKEVVKNPGAATAPGTAKNKELSADEAIEQLHRWIKEGKIPQSEMAVMKVIVKDHDSQKEKIVKLKSLLGRSAKAQREAKVDLDATLKKLENTTREIDRLNRKIEKLANRPTHMELLADFETNFDRALLSVGSQQVGGEETAPSTSMTSAMDKESAVVDNLLMQELNDARARVEKLESLNGALMHRASQLEGEVKDRRREHDELSNKVSRLELEKRMAVMEAEHATRSMQEKAASLAEMQMEIDMVTRASMTANVRAAQGEEIMKTVKTDKKRVQELESQVQALQEWALASSEAKTLAQERVKLLETQLRSLQHGNSGQAGEEHILATYKGSLVIGAGDIGSHVVVLEDSVLEEAKSAERVVLRWHFDLNKEDTSVDFSLLKGKCPDKSKHKNADPIIDKRVVRGGAEGEQEYAFAVDNACTMVFSNEKSWIRPRTVQYTISLLASSR